MTAQEIYGLVFVAVPGVAVTAAVWYFLYSHHHHRRRRSRGAAMALATGQVLVGAMALGWLLAR
jgi:hypothetical protein